MPKIVLTNGSAGAIFRAALNSMFTDLFGVVGTQVPAIGLDAKTDSEKITAIIAALRAHGLMGPNA